MRTFIPLLFLLPLATACASGPNKAELDAEVKQLCEQDGGIKVYETVKLPSEKFDKYDNVHIPLKKNARPNDEYFYEWEIRTIKSGKPDDGGPAEMWRSNFKYFRSNDLKLLGEYVSYTRRGGDLPGPWHPSSFTCPEPATSTGVEKLIFLKGETK